MEERVAIVSAGSGLSKGAAKGIAKGGGNASAPAQVSKLSEHDAAEYPRFSAGLGEVNRVLGGGIVPGSAIVLSGLPGSGKSTMMSSTCDFLAGDGKRVLYVAGEESAQQIRLRTDRLGLNNSGQIDITSDCEVGAVCARIASGYDFAVIDSIQTVWDGELTGAPGSVSIVKSVGQALVRTAKESGCSVLIVGHVNKDGNLAGPRHMEHMVDAVLELGGERTEAYRILRAQKNRFGATDEIGVFEMTGQGLIEVEDPTAMFLAEHGEKTSGSVVCPTMEGTRPLLIETQALASPTHMPTPMRRARGVDKNRLDMLLAVLGQRSGWNLKLGTRDVYLNISGGMKIEEPAVDLAVCVAVASAATGRPVKSKLAVFGEVSLLGEVRPVQGADRRVSEAQRMGFTTIVAGPGQGTKSVKTLKAALNEALESEPVSPIAEEE
jgi:DNA repair protein RadA/Sms